MVELIEVCLVPGEECVLLLREGGDDLLVGGRGRHRDTRAVENVPEVEKPFLNNVAGDFG